MTTCAPRCTWLTWQVDPWPSPHPMHLHFQVWRFFLPHNTLMNADASQPEY